MKQRAILTDAIYYGGATNAR